MKRPRAGSSPGRPAALAQYRQRADVYDSELTPFEPIRVDAIAKLELRAGDTVLDIGCGTGLSFSLLEGDIGPGGRIVGVEQSPEMMAKAQDRVAGSRWRNVQLECAPAATADIGVRADAALFHFTHDVVRDERALANVARHLKPGARVVASGLQWAPAWLAPVNGFVWLAAMYSTTSLEGLDRPWSRLAAHLHDVQLQTASLGGVYIASGIFNRY